MAGSCSGAGCGLFESASPDASRSRLCFGEHVYPAADRIWPDRALALRPQCGHAYVLRGNCRGCPGFVTPWYPTKTFLAEMGASLRRRRPMPSRCSCAAGSRIATRRPSPSRFLTSSSFWRQGSATRAACDLFRYLPRPRRVPGRALTFSEEKTKRLLRFPPLPPIRPWPPSLRWRRHKSLLVLFFRKEHSSTPEFWSR
jgi:hypothetical protein